MTPSPGRLFFTAAKDGSRDTALWSTDGTPERERSAGADLGILPPAEESLAGIDGRRGLLEFERLEPSPFEQVAGPVRHARMLGDGPGTLLIGSPADDAVSVLDSAGERLRVQLRNRARRSS